MDKIKQDTESLIASLSDDLTKVKLMPHPLLRVLPWFLIANIYVVIAVFVLGLRDDIALKLHDSTYIFELLYVFVIATSSALCSAWLCVPDARGKKRMVAIPLLLTAFAILIIIYYHGDLNGFQISWHKCYDNSLVFGAVPAFVILFISMKGKTTHPYFMSFMNAMSIGALGYIGLRLTCSSDNIVHLCCVHILPYLLLGIIMALLGRRLFRW